MSNALALCACQLDTSVPEARNDFVRALDAALPASPWQDAGGTIWTAPGSDAAKPPIDAGSPPPNKDAGNKDAGNKDAGNKDAGNKDAGKTPVGGGHAPAKDADVPNDAAQSTDATVDAHMPPMDAGRCRGMCPADRPHCLEDATCAQCALDTDCASPTPRCEPATHSCVTCLQPSDCGGATPACNLATHACVGCLSDANCAGVLAHCDLNAQRCVACLGDGDCTDPAQARCEAGACQPCTENAQCTHLPATHVCGIAGDSDGEGNAGRCVECATHADCTDLAHPECDDNQCGTCTSNDACEHRPSASVCDDGEQRSGPRQGERGTGACVECNAQHEDACGDRVCDTQQKRCSDRERQSAQLCAPCVSDSECDGERICASAESDEPNAASYCVIESNAASCLENCAQGLPLACAFGF